MDHLPPARHHPRGPRRIVSLVPHATELLFALGLGDRVVGVTHECDHPRGALALPRVTFSRLRPGLDARGIDEAVSGLARDGRSPNGLDAGALEELRPDLVITQELCAVCAVSHEDVVAITADLPGPPDVLALDPHTLGETLDDVRTVADLCGVPDAGRDLLRTIGSRTDRIRVAVRSAPRPRVVAVEWLDPVYVAGHWTPQLIEMAGGIDLLGLPGEHSARSTWEDLALLRPDVVVCMPCGYDAARSLEESLPHVQRLWATGAARVVAIDANGLLTRPGPRLAGGIETLAHAFHPGLVPSAPGAVLDVPRTAVPAVRP